jgi:hypothetical protein
MLLQALNLARSGGSVLLLDRDSRRGGAWQTATVEDERGGPLTVESACHVIEVFPGVYDLLERASGVEFADLKPQPIRIHPTGLTVPYFGRLVMALSLARLTLGYFLRLVQRRLFNRGDEESFLNFRHKLRSLLDHQAPEILSNSPMKGPKTGFYDFMSKLENQCLEANVVFETFNVTKLTRADGRWLVQDAAGQLRQASNLHVTTSANFQRTNKHEFEAVKPELIRRQALAVSVPVQQLHIEQSYVAFWGDPLVSRISRLDTACGTEKESIRFLVEFRNTTVHQRSDFDTIVRNKLISAQILKPDGKFRQLGLVECRFARNIDQLPSGQFGENLFGYYSYGNLAAGIAAWIKYANVKSGAQSRSI